MRLGGCLELAGSRSSLAVPKERRPLEKGGTSSWDTDEIQLRNADQVHYLSGKGVSHDPIRILSVEGHPVFREGLRSVIGSQRDMVLFAQAADEAEAVRELRRLRPDILLTDICFSNGDGEEMLAVNQKEFPRSRIIVLASLDCDGDIQRALRAGASAYVLKTGPKEELPTVLRSVHVGKRHISPDVAARLAEHLGDEDLTRRELEVLQYVWDGHRSKEIADQLQIAEATVVKKSGDHVEFIRIALGGVGAKPWRSFEAEQSLHGKAATPANFRVAAEAALRGARPQSQNGFKIELARRCLVHALTQATA